MDSDSDAVAIREHNNVKIFNSILQFDEHVYLKYEEFYYCEFGKFARINYYE